jgi:hypothetical protein
MWDEGKLFISEHISFNNYSVLKILRLSRLRISID